MEAMEPHKGERFKEVRRISEKGIMERAVKFVQLFIQQALAAFNGAGTIGGRGN